MGAESPWIARFLAQERLPDSYRGVIEDICRPVAARIAGAAAHQPFLAVGICGAQGSGKSTMAAALEALLVEQGLPTARLSIDDLYLTHAERSELARRVHPLLQTRGVPGTHDVALGLEVFAQLRQPGLVALPAFDKQVDDRRARSGWPGVQAPLRVLLFEGWCVGARAQSAGALATPVNALERDEDAQGAWRGYVNAALAGPYRALFDPLDLQVLLAAPGFEAVYAWRLEQEHKLRQRVAAEGGDASRVMSDAAVARFISHYERITRHILREMPARADVVVQLDTTRRMSLARQ